MTTAAGERGRLPWRLVLWAGLALGTFLTVTEVMHGERWRLTSLPLGVPYLLGALAEWAALVVLAGVAVAAVVAAGGWLARHRRVLWHHGRRAGSAALRAGREHGGPLGDRLAARAGQRWQGRTWAPLVLRRGDGDQADELAVPWWRRAADVLCARGDLADDGDQHHNHQQDDQDHEDDDDQHDGTPGPGDAEDQAVAPAAAGTDQEVSGMTTNTTATAARAAGAAAGWKALASDTADFKPADDGELLAWMAEQVRGMLGYGDALTAVHETCVRSVGLDPAAMAALHDVADAAAECAGAMAKAIDRFRDVYAGPREFAADGGVLPHKGRFITGED